MLKKLLTNITVIAVGVAIGFGAMIATAQNIPSATGPKRPDLKVVQFPNMPSKYVQASTSNNIGSRLSYPAGITNMLITGVVGSTNASPVSGSVAATFNYSADGVHYSTYGATTLTLTLNGTNGVCQFTNPIPIVVNGNGWIELTKVVVTGTNTVWFTNLFLSYPTGAGQ